MLLPEPSGGFPEMEDDLVTILSLCYALPMAPCMTYRVVSWEEGGKLTLNPLKEIESYILGHVGRVDIDTKENDPRE